MCLWKSTRWRQKSSTCHCQPCHPFALAPSALLWAVHCLCDLVHVYPCKHVGLVCRNTLLAVSCALCTCVLVLSQAVHPCSTLGSEEQLVLPGYGVEAVLKNMEYSAMDEKAKADAAAAAKKAAAKAGAGSGDDSGDIDVSSLGEVKGFKFDVLAQRKPHLVQELATFRDVLMSNDEEETIKVRGHPDAACAGNPLL